MRSQILIGLMAILVSSANALVMSSSVRPVMPVGYCQYVLKHGLVVLTNSFNTVSADESLQLGDLLQYADREDVVTFRRHDGSFGFEAVADVDQDGILNWYDQRGGKNVNDVLLSAYGSVFSWRRKSYRENVVTLFGMASEHVFSDAASKIEKAFNTTTQEIGTLEVPFPAPPGKIFRIVLKDQRVADVFFDRATDLLVEVGAHKPMDISRSDIVEVRELPMKKVVGHSLDSVAEANDKLIAVPQTGGSESLNKLKDEENQKSYLKRILFGLIVLFLGPMANKGVEVFWVGFAKMPVGSCIMSHKLVAMIVWAAVVFTVVCCSCL